MLLKDIPADFSAESKVWIYQCNRMLADNECIEIKDILSDFASTWKSHGHVIKGYGSVLFNRFLLLLADESATGVSGCSTDSSVRLMKDIEIKYGISLFDRLTLAFLINKSIATIPLSQFQDAINEGIINEDSLYFNNTVLTREALEHEWIVPVQKSWLTKILLSHK